MEQTRPAVLAQIREHPPQRRAVGLTSAQHRCNRQVRVLNGVNHITESPSDGFSTVLRRRYVCSRVVEHVGKNQPTHVIRPLPIQQVAPRRQQHHVPPQYRVKASRTMGRDDTIASASNEQDSNIGPHPKAQQLG